MSGPLKPVIVWIHGGGLQDGSASFAVYDGTSFAKNQGVVFVSFNYRLNVFGFPMSRDLPRNNLGFLDHERAFSWVQENIAQFGGDKSKVTIMGQSAGSKSVSLAITRRNSTDAPPFRAAIMLSGVEVPRTATADFSKFDAFASAMGCTQSHAPLRLQCLRNVSASTIRNYTNGPDGASVSFEVDNVTAFADPLQRIHTGQIAQVPIIIGNMEDDGTVFVYGTNESLSTYLADRLGSRADLYPPPLVRALYPGLNDSQVIDAVERDLMLRCPVKLWSDAFVRSGIKSVYRYSYGAVFADLERLPNLGAYHGSELPILFGTYNTSTATTEEEELSESLQTAFANFAKNPGNVSESPAPNWPAYEPGLFEVARIPTLAKIGYEGNVALDDFIDPVQPISTDKPCVVWDPLLDPDSRRTLTSADNHITCMMDNQVYVQDSTSSSLLRLQVSG